MLIARMTVALIMLWKNCFNDDGNVGCKYEYANNGDSDNDCGRGGVGLESSGIDAD